MCLHHGAFAVCRLPADAEAPAWASGSFASVTRTPDELSVVCAAPAVPADVRAERDWRMLEVRGPLAFDAVGVLASIVGPLAVAQVSLFATSTYDTDYIFVKNTDLERAIVSLTAAGHAIQPA